MNFKSKKWTIPLLLVLIFLSVGVFIRFSLGFTSFGRDFKGLFFNSFSQNPFAKQSEVTVYLVDSKLKLDFDLTEEDKLKLGSFMVDWFGEIQDLNNISIGIDENLTKFLSSSFPTKLILSISDKGLGFNKELDFRSQTSPILQNPLVKNDFEFATGSGKLSVKYTDPSRYKLEINNPEDLAFYATSSGILTASDKIEGLFKSLSQVATIEMNVNGKNISGSIKLK